MLPASDHRVAGVVHRHRVDDTTDTEEITMSTPRLRVLELPMEHQGEYTNTPYLLIIDRCTEAIANNLATVDGDALNETTGARGLLAFDFEINLE